MESPNQSAERNALIALTVESWRFWKMFHRVLTKLDAGEQGRYESQLRWFRKKMEESLDSVGLRIIDIEGQPFEPGIAATPLNIAEFEAGDMLSIEQMIEPIIMGNEGLVKMGTVTLQKVRE